MLLGLDHVDNDGAKHRQQFGGRNRSVFIDLRKQFKETGRWPQEPRLQTLCVSCHARKSRMDARTGESPERWAVLPSLSKYQVSDRGRIRSFKSVKSGGLLTPWLSKGGSLYIRLRPDGENSARSFPVHALVAEAFIGPRPDGFLVVHLDGDPSNCHVSNLKYLTKSQQVSLSVSTGRNHLSSRTHCVNGHEFTEDNTYKRPRGRGCRRCHAISSARLRAGHSR